jgi:alpha-L-rhamnosidase
MERSGEFHDSSSAVECAVDRCGFGEWSCDGQDEGVSRPMPIFRREFQVDKPVQRAVLYIAGLGQDEVHINGVKVGDRELAPGWTDYRKRILYDTYDVSALVQ